MRPNETDYAAGMPFAATNGVEVLAASADEVRARLAWKPERCTSGGILHGGALMTLADSAGGLCAFLNLPQDATTATVESKYITLCLSVAALVAVAERSVSRSSAPPQAARSGRETARRTQLLMNSLS